MALLTTTRAERTRGILAIALFGALFSGACHFLADSKPLALGFNHRLHFEDEGLDCSDCHMDVEDAEDPGMPGQRTCELCHNEDMEAERPIDRRIQLLFEEQEYKTTGVYRLADEIVFSHLEHAAAAESCADCHAGIEESTHPSDLSAITMDDCMSCHEREGVSNECATCHSQIDRGWAPDSHALDWTRFHGAASQSEREGQANRCDLCHEENSCNQCHLANPPRSHTNHWRMRGHGVVAKMERQDCTVCHRPESCDRCHQDTRPSTHRGAWAGSASIHCASCHFPVRGEGCATCHRSTPRHTTATPVPPDHNLSRDCRICHGVDAPMPHFDNGDLCVICHR